MRPHPIVTCSKTLAANASAAPLDVVKMKSALGALGHYEAPAWGVSQFPETALFDAIKAFQKSQGLKSDGAIKPGGETEAALSQAMTPRRATTALQATAQALQSLGRDGDELLAHITPQEAALLHNITDGATVNPQTGLLEFFYGGFGGQPDGGKGRGTKEGSGDHGFDPSADHKANQGSTLSGGTGGKKDGFGGGDNSSKASGSDDQGMSTNATGTQTKTQKDQGGTSTPSGNTRARRASAKEDTLPGDYLGDDGLTKKDAKDDELMDLTIDDVEQENKAIMDQSKKLAAEAKRKEEEDRKVWHEVPYWSPGLNPTPPIPPQGPPSRWNNNPNSPENPNPPQSPVEEDETRELSRREKRVMVKAAVALAKEFLKTGAKRIGPYGLVDTELLKDLLDEAYGLNDDPV